MMSARAFGLSALGAVVIAPLLLVGTERTGHADPYAYEETELGQVTPIAMVLWTLRRGSSYAMTTYGPDLVQGPNGTCAPDTVIHVGEFKPSGIEWIVSGDTCTVSGFEACVGFTVPGSPAGDPAPIVFVTHAKSTCAEAEGSSVLFGPNVGGVGIDAIGFSNQFFGGRVLDLTSQPNLIWLKFYDLWPIRTNGGAGFALGVLTGGNLFGATGPLTVDTSNLHSAIPWGGGFANAKRHITDYSNPFIVVGSIGANANSGAARLYLNDVAYHDDDCDGLGNELEADLGMPNGAGGCGGGASGYELAGDWDRDGLSDADELFGKLHVPPLSGYLPLPLWGATPDHHDVFVEVDVHNDPDPFNGNVTSRMTAPQVANVQSRLAAIGAASLGNPDLQDGVRVHMDVGISSCASGTTNCSTMWGDWGGVGTIVEMPQDCFSASCGENFNLPSQYRDCFLDPTYPDDCTPYGTEENMGRLRNWAVDTGVGLAASRRGYFRYALITDTDDSINGGQARGPTFWVKANRPHLFTHELGHTLGLKHDGVRPGATSGMSNDRSNCKPNYHSVMNYAAQGIAGMGFSDGTLPPIIPAMLNEQTGLAGFATTVSGGWIFDNQSLVADPAQSTVDWDRDGQFSGVGVRGDVLWGANHSDCNAYDSFRDVADVAQGSAVELSKPAVIEAGPYLWAMFRTEPDGALATARYRSTMMPCGATVSPTCCPSDLLGTCGTWVSVSSPTSVDVRSDAVLAHGGPGGAAATFFYVGSGQNLYANTLFSGGTYGSPVLVPLTHAPAGSTTTFSQVTVLEVVEQSDGDWLVFYPRASDGALIRVELSGALAVLSETVIDDPATPGTDTIPVQFAASVIEHPSATPVYGHAFLMALQPEDPAERIRVLQSLDDGDSWWDVTSTLFPTAPPISVSPPELSVESTSPARVVLWIAEPDTDPPARIKKYTSRGTTLGFDRDKRIEAEWRGYWRAGLTVAPFRGSSVAVGVLGDTGNSDNVPLSLHLRAFVDGAIPVALEDADDGNTIYERSCQILRSANGTSSFCTETQGCCSGYQADPDPYQFEENTCPE